MIQGVFRILMFESRQMKDVRLLDDRLKRRESRWVRKACMSWALDDGDLYMDENVIFLLLSVIEMVRHSNIFGMNVVSSSLTSKDKLLRT